MYELYWDANAATNTRRVSNTSANICFDFHGDSFLKYRCVSLYCNTNAATNTRRVSNTSANICFDFHGDSFLKYRCVSLYCNTNTTTNRWWVSNPSANICFYFHQSFLPSLTRTMRDYSDSFMRSEFPSKLQAQHLHFQFSLFQHQLRC
jgi:hypothetical protein